MASSRDAPTLMMLFIMMIAKQYLCCGFVKYNQKHLKIGNGSPPERVHCAPLWRSGSHWRVP